MARGSSLQNVPPERRCAAVTRAGKQCPNWRVGQEEYCSVHSGIATKAASLKRAVDRAEKSRGEEHVSDAEAAYQAALAEAREERERMARDPGPLPDGVDPAKFGWWRSYYYLGESDSWRPGHIDQSYAPSDALRDERGKPFRWVIEPHERIAEREIHAMREHARAEFERQHRIDVASEIRRLTATIGKSALLNYGNRHFATSRAAAKTPLIKRLHSLKRHDGEPGLPIPWNEPSAVSDQKAVAFIRKVVRERFDGV